MFVLNSIRYQFNAFSIVMLHYLDNNVNFAIRPPVISVKFLLSISHTHLDLNEAKSVFICLGDALCAG